MDVVEGSATIGKPVVLLTLVVGEPALITLSA